MKYAILETNGQLSVLPWAREKRPTHELGSWGCEAEEGGLPRVVISDGRVLDSDILTGPEARTGRGCSGELGPPGHAGSRGRCSC